MWRFVTPIIANTLKIHFSQVFLSFFLFQQCTYPLASNVVHVFGELSHILLTGHFRPKTVQA